MASQYRKLPVEDGGAPGTVDSFNGRTGIVVSQSGDYTASQITNVPAGNISATDVQAAINELDSEKLSSALTSAHIFVGNGSNVATDVALSGDATLANTGALTLANTAVTPGTYGTATQVSTITVDSKGRLTAASNTSIQIAESQVTNLTTDLAAKQSTTLTDGHILVGNASNVATDVAMTGDVTITNAGVTTIAVGAVTDTKASLSVKPAVTVAATSNLTLSGAQTIDGQLTTAGTSIVLATAQTAPAENGPWVVQSGAWTRPTWFPSGGTTQAIQFSTYMVRLGTIYQGSTWRQTTAMPITIDTTGIAFSVTPLAVNSNTITGIVPVANGGTALSTTPTNGQILIGNGTNYTLATLTAGNGIAVTNGGGTITVTAANFAVITKTANYTLTATDAIILVDSSGGAFNLTLPDPATVTGHIYRIVDSTGNLNANPVTLVRFASEKIEGLAASKALQTKWGGWQVFSNGTDWFIF